MQIADRIGELGTETAFAVGAEAAAFAREGMKVYPFHLGDINVITPENIRKMATRAMEEGNTGYCPNAGIFELRKRLADDIGKARDMTLGPENVSIQPGGKPVIGKFIQTFMNPGDEVLYPNPGYPIYESQIKYFGGVAVPYGFVETDIGFEINLEQLRNNITPRTKLLIYNNYQNPIGCWSTHEERQALADIVLEHDLIVLSDEAYFDIIYNGRGYSIAALPGMFERTVILYTFAKKFAMTGWRLGAAIATPEIIEVFNKLNTNNESCSNHFNQYAAIEALTGPQENVSSMVDMLRKRRDVLVDLLNDIPGIHTHRPESTFYLFVNVTKVMEAMGLTDLEEFRKNILKNTGVSFCTRNHFGSPLPGETEKYVRFAYSGIEIPDMQEGIAKMKKYILEHSK